MARVLKTRSAVRLLAGLAVLTGLVLTGSLLTDSHPAFAAKPVPPPPGKIYLKFHPSLISFMNGDGSSLTAALPAAAMNYLTPGYPLCHSMQPPLRRRQSAQQRQSLVHLDSDHRVLRFDHRHHRHHDHKLSALGSGRRAHETRQHHRDRRGATD